METAHFYALLCELCEHLVDETKLVGSVSRRRRRRDLLSRLQSTLAAGGSAPPYLVEAIRHEWTDDGRVRIDDAAPCRIDSTGVWIGAWLLAANGADAYEEIDPRRLAGAIAALPPLARDVFTLHSRDGLGYPSIAAKLAISEETVRRELAAALVALDLALHIQPGDDLSPIA